MFNKCWFVLLVLLSHSANATLILGNGYGANGNFVNNGSITTEYRNGVAVREWLDLTKTNGIAYDVLVEDLADGQLGNHEQLSFPDGFIINVGAFLDLRDLSSSELSGWKTVSLVNISDMFTEFFGVPISGHTTYSFNENVEIVEEFILLFGDTHHEGTFDRYGFYPDEDRNTFLDNIGFSFGLIDTYRDFGSNELSSTHVFDGQYVTSLSDGFDDLIDVWETNGRTTSFGRHDQGTWLVRDIVSVPEPASVALFIVMLCGFAYQHRSKF
ncbi:hypothetical protein [Agarivorans sp. 1_MG-2023]|uniref:hypothetical protein n=1 Tax=Agarivorans sp. 1_MG-2023 TaxID=3062634 RepID=UPI0026E13003|nr:hypothetical protein [Agarivorans sp. 1_MG-2023]MDO6763207.1 hypothetical protein [Agarivorans sp. 1_MG-2023]